MANHVAIAIGTPMDSSHRITHFENDSFFSELDQLVRDRVPIVIVVPTKPPKNSRLYKRLRICQAPMSIDEALYKGQLQSGRWFIVFFGFIVRTIFNRPSYRGYYAQVHSELEPLEVHLTPL